MLPAQSSLSTLHPLLHCLGEVLLLRVSPNLSLKKTTSVENLCWTRLEKNYLLAGAASTEIRRLCQQRSAGYARVASGEVGTCAEKKILEIGS